jgi:asparagine synthetase B (glutamine-hydrolysing)
VKEALTLKLEKATNIMRHRGPDDEGYVMIGESATISTGAFPSQMLNS